MIRFLSAISLGVLVAIAGLPPNQATATECANLPPSKLNLYNMDMPASEEEMAPAAELDQRIPPNGLASLHTLMLTVKNLIGRVRVKHRAVPQADGMVCDAPELVEFAFGASLRKTVIADVVADDACVRRQMADHEVAHTRAFSTAIDRFIRDNQATFRQGMTILKKMPASSFEKASEQWDKGLKLIMDASKQMLLTDLREANADVDSTSALTSLEAACGGKIRKLQQAHLYK